MVALCRRHGVSRECGYKWWRRFKAGGWPGLRSLGRRPWRAWCLKRRWWSRLMVVRRKERSFGPKKLHWKLRQTYPRLRLPAVRTLARWLAAAGMRRRRKRRARPGPPVRLAGRLSGHRVNQVWSIDVKGSFRTGDGRRVNALTVRDLASRYVLCVRQVGSGDETRIAAVMRRLFRRHGLPQALRMDNGTPFGAMGPRGWSHLSATWVKLGIRLEYGRPRCPQDNAEHEQMHRILKERTAQPASANPGAQQRRFDRWRQWYNHRRPHEAINLRVPAALYTRSPRGLPRTPPLWHYPANWERLYPDAKGRCQWRKRQRLIGQAFIHEELGGRSCGPDILAVYFGPHLIGTLHARDLAGLRPVQCQRNPVTGGAAPLPNPPRFK
jgi:putative transposase